MQAALRLQDTHHHKQQQAKQQGGRRQWTCHSNRRGTARRQTESVAGSAPQSRRTVQVRSNALQGQARILHPMGPSPLPISLLTDSYKATHFLQYPDADKMVAYGEFRCGYNKDSHDTRVLYYGIRYLVEHYVARQWTMQDVQQADLFFRTHMAPMYTEFPFPRALFEKFIQENNGYFPVKIEALPEGTVGHARLPVYQITAADEYSKLCTYLETLLTMIWYPTTVATLSRRARDVVERAFERTSDGGKQSPLVQTKLQDFGFRGCTCIEQTVIGGCAHLLSFRGSDTLSAAYYAQFNLNGGRPVAQSIPATEHSVMTAWPTEQEAIENMINHFGTGVFACVMDSYDYAKALSEVVPAIASKKVGKGGYMVLRPDSGDPTEAVLMALVAAERVFGSDVNSKGYKVIKGCGVIQGDGIDIEVMKKISLAVEAAGFAGDNVTYGMGGGLLQKVNRDTMSFATKLSHIVYSEDHRAADVMKQPTTDSGKFSLPGVLAVKRVNGIPTVFPAGEVSQEENMLKVVYDRGPVPGFEWDDFDTVRERAAREWAALPPAADPLSPSLKAKIATQMRLRGKTPPPGYA